MFLFFSTDSPSFQSSVENVTLIWGQPSSLLCQARGAPAPVITWFKNATMLQNSTSVIYETKSYSQRERYVCNASNSFGLEKKEFLIKTQSKFFGALLFIGEYFVIYMCHVCKCVSPGAVCCMLHFV